MSNQPKTEPCPGPLEGVVVLDITRALAGPFTSMLLGDLGAEVIKVEPPASAGLDYTSRTPGVDNQSFKGEDLQFLSVHRNKKSITVNLRSEKGKEIVYDLAVKVDVVLDNFRAGVMKRLKLDFETLSKINPRIVCCSVTGFGQTGPYRDRPSFDSITQALSGVMGVTGEPGRPPCKVGISIGDLAGPVYGLAGVCAALYHAEKTGRGQQVDISLLDCLTSLAAHRAALYLVAGEVQGPVGGRDSRNPLHGAFPARDGYFVVAAHRQAFWENMCRAIGREDLLAESKYETSPLRVQNAPEIWGILDAIFRTQPVEHWIQLLIAHDVPCAPVYSIDQMVKDPQLLSRGMIATLEHPEGGQIRVLGNPLKMSSIQKQRYTYPPSFGQHTEEVLSKLLGYSKDKIEALRAEGAI
ncbi:MAG: CoA transferase [Chloroflexi bacterium]|nr:CoA transferase [Chloroflexota bacterium]